MATGERAATATAVSGMLVRWLPPSPPLAVDDEPLWRPAPDPRSQSARTALEGYVVPSNVPAPAAMRM